MKAIHPNKHFLSTIINYKVEVMSKIDDFVVPWVKEVKPYIDEHIAFAWENPTIDRLMSNENFHHPSKKVIKAVKKIIKKGNLYPNSGTPLRLKIAENEGLKMGNVFIANGSSEVMDVITRVFIKPGDEAVIPVPTFPMYELRVSLSGGKVIKVPIKKNLTWELDNIIEKINSHTRLIFITSPNNPIGTTFPEKDLIHLLETGIPVVLDEAYYELQDETNSMSHLLKEFENLIIMRTMSKAWGIAGFRIGYSLASEKITDYFNRMRINFSIGTINMEAAIAAYDDIAYFNKQNNETKKLRKVLEQNLKNIKDLRVFPSSGNFILMDFSGLGIKAEKTIDYFIKHGIQIRSMSKPSLGPGFARVTIGNCSQNNKFIKILQQLISDKYI